MENKNSSPFINIHTHELQDEGSGITISNLILKPGEEVSLPEIGCFSAGIHPWFLDLVNPESTIDLLRSLALQHSVAAIGECGLDLALKTSVELQKFVFLEQAKIAEEVKKPLIIHCVRAYHILDELMGTIRPNSPWIFHGFNQNQEIASRLIQKGASVSIGSSIFAENSKIRKSLPAIPLEHIFLETDESEYSITDIYMKVSELLEIPLNQLKDRIYSNYLNCFSEKR